MSTIRWFFNASKWMPTKEEWLLAIQCIQSEELSRIYRFVFKKDIKLALIGRLLMRNSLQKAIKSIDYKDMKQYEKILSIHESLLENQISFNKFLSFLNYSINCKNNYYSKNISFLTKNVKN